MLQRLILMSLCIFALLLIGCGSGQNGSSSSSQTSSTSTSNNSQQALILTPRTTDPCQFSGVIENEHTSDDEHTYWNGDNTVEARWAIELEADDSSNSDITIRYANGTEQARSARLTLGNLHTEIIFPSTGDWSDWAAVTINTNHAQGIQTLALTSTSANGLPNIDQLSIEGSQWTISPCPASPSNRSVFFPDLSHGAANVDTYLAIRFDQAPELYNSGAVKIIDSSTGQVVDTLNLPTDNHFIRPPNQSLGRALKRQPAVRIGNEIRFYPHNNALSPLRQYTVEIGEGVFRGIIDGTDTFQIDPGQWQFTTGEQVTPKNSVTVDDDGPSDFRTVQGALNFLMEHQLSNSEVIVEPGQYYELLFLRGLNNVSIVGRGVDQTRIFNRNAEFINSGSGASSDETNTRGGRPLFLVENTDLLSIRHLTLHNTYQRNENSGQGAQAEALYFNSASGRLSVQNVHFKSEQDTLLLKGYSWFYQSIISGNVDFIWGYPKLALFEQSEIQSLGDSKNPSGDSGGYVVQARVQSASDPGVIFLNSHFTRALGPAGNGIGNGKTYLARSGNSANSQDRFDNISFIQCRFDGHIAATGWFDESDKGKSPNPIQATTQSGLREYRSATIDGQPISPQRHPSFYRLSDSDFLTHFQDRATIFSQVNQYGEWLNVQ